MTIENVIFEIQSQFKDVIGEDLSDYENKIIETSIKIPFARMFSSPSVISDQIQIMIGNLSDLNYLRDRIVTMRYKLNQDYRNEYDRRYTILTRAGRPSKQAIDSEMHCDNEELTLKRNKLEDFSNLIEWLTNQIRLVEMSIKNYESQRFNFK